MLTRACADCATPIEARYARYCADCRWRHRGKARKYVWTPERDHAIREAWLARIPRRSQLLADRWGVPKWAVTHRAVELGVTRPEAHKRPWTAQEEAFLFAHAGTRHDRWIARKLGRTLASVTLKARRMRLRLTVREGYTVRELELCFGVGHRVIERWVKAGMLEVQRRGYDTDRDPWAVTDAALLRFIQAHPMAFELRRVDQHWFMDLILNGALVKQALAALRADDAEAAA